MEKQIKENLVYEGNILNVYHDEVELENGSHTYRDVVRHNGGVCIGALDNFGNIAVVRQYRYPIARVCLELPAGKIDKGEQPLHAAVRELSEETGLEADEIIDLGKYYPTVGYSDEAIYMYCAKGLKKKSMHLDDDEFLDFEMMNFKELYDKILSGEVSDGKTIALVLKIASLNL